MLTTKYAPREIGLIVVLGAGATALCAYFLHYWALAPAVIALALLAFFRDPPRHAPADADLILAPADGRVVEIARGAAGPEGAGPVLRVMIFLSVLDVHVNRSPCTGRVTDAHYRPGEFLSALNSQADVRNECNTLSIEPRAPLPGPAYVRQIAGVLARRIVCTAAVGDELAAGQSFGMIKLGSRTEVCLPESPAWEVLVALGDKVKAGQTVLARLRPEGPPADRVAT